MGTNKKIAIREVDERTSISLVIPKLYNHDKYFLNYHLSPLNKEGKKNCPWDVMVQLVSKATSRICSRQIIEIKIRDRFYSTYLIEKQKWDKLFRVGTDVDCRPIYINVTPNGTYVWDLKKIDPPKWKKEMHNVCSTDPSQGKRLKNVGYLDVESAKVINITTSDVYKLDNSIKREVIEKVKKHQRRYDLYDLFISETDKIKNEE